MNFKVYFLKTFIKLIIIIIITTTTIIIRLCIYIKNLIM
jgi:hypothetical protein